MQKNNILKGIYHKVNYRDIFYDIINIPPDKTEELQDYLISVSEVMGGRVTIHGPQYSPVLV